MLYQRKETIDTRTPLQKIRRTTLYRFLTLHGVKCNDSDPATKLRGLIVDHALLGDGDEIIPAKVNEAWSKRKEKAEVKEDKAVKEDKKVSDLKRPELVKLAASLGIKNPMKMKNPELIKAVEDAQNAP